MDGSCCNSAQYGGRCTRQGRNIIDKKRGQAAAIGVHVDECADWTGRGGEATDSTADDLIDEGSHGG